MRYQSENFNGAYDFRCRFHDGWQIAANLHEYSELLYCQQGQGLVTVNGQSISLSAGQLAWIPPNYIHKYDFPDAQVICAVFSNDLIPLFFNALAGRYFLVSAVRLEELAYIPELLLNLKKEDSLCISGYLNLICHKVISCASFASEKHSDGILYQKIISYIAEHYTEDISLAQIAKLFGYNEKYLSHTLHELTGIQFRQLLAFYRVGHAKKLLTGTKDRGITDIAMDSGFSALNTFHRTFKELTGMTPSEYRKKYAY
ncbi:MAG: helix-turn-helix domain-containing protein [Oscillospiraceae bacterium]|nr:helix-turn-helix domain-containing protein [Oscillospiraceae bacterium]